MKQDERYWCPKCERWFPADLIKGMMHTVVLLAGPDTRHVVIPEPEALALLREKGASSGHTH